jgi:DNA-binding NtrC family response regulator
MMRILIVEDDLALLKLYATVLKDRGHQVHQAATVQAALDMIYKYDFDACVCDMQIGHHSGIELLQWHPELQAKGTHFIAISGFPRYQEICATLGVDFYTKPIANQQLINMVEAAV